MTQTQQRKARISLHQFRVNDTCIACDTCTGIAPLSFRMTPNYEQAVVYQQPLHPNEDTLCQEALEACPVGAIGYQHG